MQQLPLFHICTTPERKQTDDSTMASKDFIYPRTPQYSSNLAAAFRQQRSNGDWTDFRLLTGDAVFPCHRFNIAAVSPMLDRLMRSGMKEANQQQARVDEIAPAILEIILRYIYTGDATVPPHQLIDTIIACDFLEMLELKEKCVKDSVKVVQPNNALSCFNVAESLKLDQLKVTCQELIASSLADIAKESEFLELSRSEMSSCIQSVQELNDDPDDALQASMAWVSHQLDERINEMEELLQNIKLTNCSVEALETEITTHEAVLDQRPTVYKILLKSLTESAKQDGGRRKRNTRNKTNTTMIVIGGENNAKCWELNSSFQFVDLCTVPDYSNDLSVCQHEVGFVVSGGQGSVSCYLFVLSTKTWTKLLSLSSPRSSHASIIFNGRLFLFGGVVSSSWSQSVESLKIDGRTWDKEPDTPANISFPQVAFVDTSIFLLDTWNTNKLYQLDMETKVWSSKEKMPGNGRKYQGASMVSVQGQLFVAGGGNNTFAQYNPATNSWCTGNTPALRHYFGALVPHQQKIYLMGGENEDRVEEYDCNTKSWSLCDFKLPQKLQYLHALAVGV